MNSRNTHGKLINIMQRLGHNVSNRGVCFGINGVALQFVLGNDLGNYLWRFGQIMDEKFIFQNPSSLSKEDVEHQTELLSLLGNVNLIQQTFQHKDLFDKSEQVKPQDLFKAAELNPTVIMENNGGIFDAGQYYNIHTPQSFAETLNLLEEGFKRHNIVEPVAIMVHDAAHAILLAYVPKPDLGVNFPKPNTNWFFHDPNQPPDFFDTNTLTEKLFHGYRHIHGPTFKDTIGVTLKVATLGSNGDKLLAALDDITNQAKWQQIHAITPHNVNQVDGAGNRLLRLAVINQDVMFARELISQGANCNDYLSSGATYLMYACREGNVAMVQALLQGGAKTEEYFNDGPSPLHFAVDGDHPKIVELLIDHNPNLRHLADKGDTPSPLGLAIITQKSKMVELLLTKGVDPNIPTIVTLEHPITKQKIKERLQPIDIAFLTGNNDILSLFLKLQGRLPPSINFTAAPTLFPKTINRSVTSLVQQTQPENKGPKANK